MTDPAGYKRAIFAAGCFWDVEAAFRRVDGVVETIAGFTGGSVADPPYELVESGTTGHAQAVGIVYDPAVLPYDRLLEIFWTLHDPTRPDGQGDYTGPQYRSAIWYFDDEQKATAIASRDRLAASGQYGSNPIVTEILPASEFWPAEECHQQFYEKCAGGFAASRQIYE